MAAMPATCISTIIFTSNSVAITLCARRGQQQKFLQLVILDNSPCGFVHAFKFGNFKTVQNCVIYRSRDKCIMSFMQRPALVIPISAIFSYLPHGSSEGFRDYPFINNVVNFVKQHEFRSFSFGALKGHRTSARPLYFANFLQFTPDNFSTSIPNHSAFRTLFYIFAISYDLGVRFSRPPTLMIRRFR